ncbi:hypothetical protein EV145_11480 [Flavobacterium sp. 245]|nr:hypothetical protein EV145_11480 [Flavobacterium sp. 245]
MNFFRCQEAIEITNKQIITMSVSVLGLSKIKWFAKVYPNPREVQNINTKLEVLSFFEVDCVFIIILVYLITARK